MRTSEPPLTFWSRAKANPTFCLATLFVATLAMSIMSTFPTAIAVRLMRLWQTGIPFSAKITPGGVLDPLTGIICIITATVSLAAVGWGYTRFSAWLERREVREFERRNAPLHIILGLVIGALLITLSVGVMVGLGDASIARGHKFVFSSSTIIPVLVSPVLEELIFRGIIFRILEKIWGTTVALASSAVLFGLTHLLNENSTLFEASLIAIELGVLLGLAYVVTRSLWLAIGLHAGWNFALGNLLGTSNSGNVVHGIFETTMRGNSLITGGAFGPEASLITPIFSLIVGAWLFQHARKHGFWKSLNRHRLA
jgi:uncharacterized protein